MCLGLFSIVNYVFNLSLSCFFPWVEICFQFSRVCRVETFTRHTPYHDHDTFFLALFFFQRRENLLDKIDTNSKRVFFWLVECFLDPIYGCFKQWVETSFRLSICKKRTSSTADQFTLAELLLSKRDERVVLERSAPTLYPSVTGPYSLWSRAESKGTWHRSLPDRWDADSRRPPFHSCQKPNVARLDKSKPGKNNKKKTGLIDLQLERRFMNE